MTAQHSREFAEAMATLRAAARAVGVHEAVRAIGEAARDSAAILDARGDHVGARVLFAQGELLRVAHAGVVGIGARK